MRLLESISCPIFVNSMIFFFLFLRVFGIDLIQRNTSNWGRRNPIHGLLAKRESRFYAARIEESMLPDVKHLKVNDRCVIN